MNVDSPSLIRESLDCNSPLLTREELLETAERDPVLKLMLTLCLRESSHSLAMRATMTPVSLIVGYDYTHILDYMHQLVAVNTVSRDDLRALFGQLERRVPIAPRVNVSDEVKPNKRRLEVQ
jgi:hypothetical protein